MWTATLPTKGTNYSASITSSTSTIASWAGLNFLAARGIGNIVTATGASGVATSNLTTTDTNSYVYSAVIYTANVSPTADNGNDLVLSTGFASGTGTQVILRKRATGIGSVTSSVSAPSASDPWAMIQFEVLTAHQSQTITGKANIRYITSRTQTGKANIRKTVSQVQAGKARIIVPSDDTYTKPHMAGIAPN